MKSEREIRQCKGLVQSFVHVGPICTLLGTTIDNDFNMILITASGHTNIYWNNYKRK